MKQYILEMIFWAGFCYIMWEIFVSRKNDKQKRIENFMKDQVQKYWDSKSQK